MTTNIEWTDQTWNPVVGCSRVSAGCMNCYAERVAHRGMSPQHKGLTRLSSKGPQWTGEVRFLPEKLGEPLRWKKPRRVFVNSMSDLFHDGLSNEQIAAVFGVMAASPAHTFQILTKRPGRMNAWFGWLRGWAKDVEGGDGEVRICMAQAHQHGADWTRHVHYQAWPLPNVWLGVSCENQATADERIPLLLDTPAAVRFISAEPLLGPIDLNLFGRSSGFPQHIRRDGSAVGMPHRLHWVIVGGESGPGARPCDLTWIRSIVDQCATAGVSCFVKQLGANPAMHGVVGFPNELVPLDRRWPQNDRKGGDMAEWPRDLRVRQFPEVAHAR